MTKEECTTKWFFAYCFYNQKGNLVVGNGETAKDIKGISDVLELQKEIEAEEGYNVVVTSLQRLDQ